MRQDNQYHAPSSDAERASVERVKALMTLIDAWPAEEPPADLVQRTMARIESSVSAPHTADQAETRQAAPRLHDPLGPVS